MDYYDFMPNFPQLEINFKTLRIISLVNITFLHTIPSFRYSTECPRTTWCPSGKLSGSVTNNEINQSYDYQSK